MFPTGLLAAAVFFVFFRLDDVVFPLIAVFVGFPASGVEGAKIAVVDVADEFGAYTDFSAGTEEVNGLSVVKGKAVRGITEKSAFFDDTTVRKKRHRVDPHPTARLPLSGASPDFLSSRAIVREKRYGRHRS